MFNQHRIYRIFQLINSLRSKPPKSPRTLANMLEVSERSIYRYFDLINQIGFDVKKVSGGRFYIEADLREGIPFTTEEVEYLASMVKSVGKNSVLSEAVLQKIGLYTEHEVAARNIFEANLGKIIEKLSIAIQEKKQVILINYFSARSQTVKNRLVEPMQFTDNYEAISAFEVSSRTNKYFNIERISAVQVQETGMKYEEDHEFYKPDIFGFQGKEMDKEVEFEMSLRASLLLKEEYPMARPYIKALPCGTKYSFKARVQAYEGPARFVRGFIDETVVIGDPKFKQLFT